MDHDKTIRQFSAGNDKVKRNMMMVILFNVRKLLLFLCHPRETLKKRMGKMGRGDYLHRLIT